MTEAAFWQSVKKGLTSNGLGVNLQLDRIENSVGNGMSDVSACCDGVERWLELKIMHGNQLKFQPSQVAWITRAQAVGRVVLVVARKNNLVLVYPGSVCRRSSAPGDPIASFSVPVSWEKLKQVIFMSLS